MPETTERFCAACGRPLVRRGEPGAWTEAAGLFAKRRTCNCACAAKIRAASIAKWTNRKANPVPDGRTCEACQKPLIRHDGEEPKVFLRRRTCDRHCGALLRAGINPRKAEVERFCQQCGRRLVRKCTHAKFAKQRFCGAVCSGAFRTIYGRVPPTPPDVNGTPSTIVDKPAEEEVTVPRNRHPMPGRAPPLATVEGTLRIEIHTGQPPRLVVVIPCRCGQTHVFAWPTTSGLTGTAGLQQLCDLRGRRLVVLDEDQAGNNAIALARYATLLKEWDEKAKV
jgi:hypothetical protein